MADWPLSAPAYVRLDLFPALVTPLVGGVAQGAVTDRGRVIITDRDFYLFLDSSNGPACTISGALYEATGDNRAGYAVTLEDGAAYSVIRATNCGCGSRLRGFTPFPGVPYQRF